MRSYLKIPSVILIIIFVVIGFLIYGGEALLGLAATDTTDFISLLPGIFVIFISFIAISQTRGLMMAGVVAGSGLGFAYLIYLMDQIDLLIPETEMVAADIELVVILVFLIIGVMLAVRER